MKDASVSSVSDSSSGSLFKGFSRKLNCWRLRDLVKMLAALRTVPNDKVLSGVSFGAPNWISIKAKYWLGRNSLSQISVKRDGENQRRQREEMLMISMSLEGKD